MAQNALCRMRPSPHIQSETVLQCGQVWLLSRSIEHENPAQPSSSDASQDPIRSRLHTQHSHRNLCSGERFEHLQRRPPSICSTQQRLPSRLSSSAMRIVIVHPKMSVMGGGERVAIHSIKEALREGHEVYLATEAFDVEGFEEFFGVQNLFKNVRLLTYPPFRPLIDRAVLYQRLIYQQERLRKIVSKRQGCDLILNTAEVANQPAARLRLC